MERLERRGCGGCSSELVWGPCGFHLEYVVCPQSRGCGLAGCQGCPADPPLCSPGRSSSTKPSRPRSPPVSSTASACSGSGSGKPSSRARTMVSGARAWRSPSVRALGLQICWEGPGRWLRGYLGSLGTQQVWGAAPVGDRPPPCISRERRYSSSPGSGGAAPTKCQARPPSAPGPGPLAAAE